MSTFAVPDPAGPEPGRRFSVPRGALRAASDFVERRVARVLGLPIRASWTSSPLATRDLTLDERRRYRERPALVRPSYLRGCRVLKELLQDIDGHEETTRLRFPHPRFSLTHTGSSALAVGSALPHLRGLGVDLEPRRAVRGDVDRLFLRDQERRWLATTDPGERAFELLRLWTVKEAVFKADPDNRGRQLYDYLVEDPSGASGGARLAAGGWKCAYVSTWLPEGVVTVAAFI